MARRCDIEKLVNESTARGIEKKEILKVEFKFSMINWCESILGFFDIGAGFYITIYKGDGEHKTTNMYPFELCIYEFDKTSCLFLKHNYKKARCIKDIGFLTIKDIENIVNDFIVLKKDTK